MADNRIGEGLDLLFAKVDTAASGATQIVAASPGNKIRVVSYVLVAITAVTVKWQRGSTDISGAMSYGATGGAVVLGKPSSHLFETAANEALNINLGAAVQVSGHISYFLGP